MTDREPLFKCECCLKPIYEGDLMSVSADGVTFCDEHAYTLQDAVNQHEEILSTIPFDCGELGYDSRDEMVRAFNIMKADLNQNGNRKLTVEA